MIEIILEILGLGNDTLNRIRDSHARVVARTLILTVLAVFGAYWLHRWHMGIIDVIISLALLVVGLIIVFRPEPIGATTLWGIASGTLKTPETIGEETKKSFKFGYALAGKVLFYLSFVFFLIGTFPVPITFPWFCVILAGGLIIAVGVFSWNIVGVLFRNFAFTYIFLVIIWGITTSGWNYFFHTKSDTVIGEIETLQKSIVDDRDVEALEKIKERIHDKKATTEDLKFLELMKEERDSRSPIKKISGATVAVSSQLPPEITPYVPYFIGVLAVIALIIIITKLFRRVSGNKPAEKKSVNWAKTIIWMIFVYLMSSIAVAGVVMIMAMQRGDIKF